jgi:hypothetical protein
MSRKLIAATAAILVAAGASAAFAATSTETGVIAQIDSKAPSITLKSGKVKTFWLDKQVMIDSLKVGEKVLVTYEMTNKKPWASAVAPASN